MFKKNKIDIILWRERERERDIALRLIQILLNNQNKIGGIDILRFNHIREDHETEI